MSRRARRLLTLGTSGALAALLLSLTSSCVSVVGGASSRSPESAEKELSPAARAAIAAAWSGIDPERLLDYHCHMTGLGTEGTGCWVNPTMKSWLHPFRHGELLVLMSSAGVEHEDMADQEYVERLVSLVRAIPDHGRCALLAFDAFHDPDGTRHVEKSTFYVPNECVIDLARRYPDVFVPVCSIHPYRKDAIEELDRCADAGCRMVKWLPNVMGMDALDPRCGPFFDEMRRRNMVLLCHVGEEKAVVADLQELGNPLRLRGPLDHGVRVIAAHCAGLGEDEDLDAPDHRTVPSFQLFLRLMDDPRYVGLLYGEISATTLANRVGTGVLETLLARMDLPERLVNGTDYPLPAANVLLRTGKLVDRGLITKEDQAVLKEIYDFNPLLFDLLVKRLIRKDGVSFPASVFMDRLGIGT